MYCEDANGASMMVALCLLAALKLDVSCQLEASVVGRDMSGARPARTTMAAAGAAALGCVA